MGKPWGRKDQQGKPEIRSAGVYVVQGPQKKEGTGETVRGKSNHETAADHKNAPWSFAQESIAQVRGRGGKVVRRGKTRSHCKTSRERASKKETRRGRGELGGDEGGKGIHGVGESFFLNTKRPSAGRKGPLKKGERGGPSTAPTSAAKVLERIPPPQSAKPPMRRDWREKKGWPTSL